VSLNHTDSAALFIPLSMIFLWFGISEVEHKKNPAFAGFSLEVSFS